MNSSSHNPQKHLFGQSSLRVVSNVPRHDAAFIPAVPAPTAMDHRQLVRMIQSIKGTHGAMRLTLLDATEPLDLADVLDLTIEPGSPEILITTASRRLLLPVTSVAAAVVTSDGSNASSGHDHGSPSSGTCPDSCASPSASASFEVSDVKPGDHPHDGSPSAEGLRE